MAADSAPASGVDNAATADDIRRAGLRRMKAIALALLAAMTALFIIARLQESDGSALWGYVRATAEAAMVGGIADWFAVTALFRHPLGLPIPHTAIVRKRKNDIGRGLGEFVSEHFLTPEAVTERLEEAHVAERIGTWLVMDHNARRVAEQGLRLLGDLVETVREEEIRGALEEAVERKVRDTPTGPILAKVLSAAIDDGRHEQVLGVALNKTAEALIEARPSLRRRMAQESPWWVPDSVDDRVFAKLFEGIMRFVLDVANNPRHEVRQQVSRRLEALVSDLQHDPALQSRMDDIRDDVLAHPQLRSWSAAVWGDVKEHIKARTLAPDQQTLDRAARAVSGFGQRLLEDPKLAATLDERLSHVVVGLAQSSKGEIGDFIASTVERWDADEASTRIELQVGRDLQFIRINGTLVGGLAGLVIHALGQLL